MRFKDLFINDWYEHHAKQWKKREELFDQKIDLLDQWCENKIDSVQYRMLDERLSQELAKVDKEIEYSYSKMSTEERLQHSIDTCRKYGVPEEKILHNPEEIDKYFLA